MPFPRQTCSCLHHFRAYKIPFITIIEQKFNIGTRLIEKKKNGNGGRGGPGKAPVYLEVPKFLTIYSAIFSSEIFPSRSSIFLRFFFITE